MSSIDLLGAFQEEIDVGAQKRQKSFFLADRSDKEVVKEDDADDCDPSPESDEEPEEPTEASPQWPLYIQKADKAIGSGARPIRPAFVSSTFLELDSGSLVEVNEASLGYSGALWLLQEGLRLSDKASWWLPNQVGADVDAHPDRWRMFKVMQAYREMLVPFSGQRTVSRTPRLLIMAVDVDRKVRSILDVSIEEDMTRHAQYATDFFGFYIDAKDLVDGHKIKPVHSRWR